MLAPYVPHKGKALKWKIVPDTFFIPLSAGGRVQSTGDASLVYQELDALGRFVRSSPVTYASVEVCYDIEYIITKFTCGGVLSRPKPTLTIV
jgi:hypothetical protein